MTVPAPPRCVSRGRRRGAPRGREQERVGTGSVVTVPAVLRGPLLATTTSPRTSSASGGGSRYARRPTRSRYVPRGEVHPGERLPPDGRRRRSLEEVDAVWSAGGPPWLPPRDGTGGEHDVTPGASPLGALCPPRSRDAYVAGTGDQLGTDGRTVRPERGGLYLNLLVPGAARGGTPLGSPGPLLGDVPGRGPDGARRRTGEQVPGGRRPTRRSSPASVRLRAPAGHAVARIVRTPRPGWRRRTDSLAPTAPHCPKPVGQQPHR